MPKYRIELELSTASALEPQQIIGEALEDWSENYGKRASEFIIGCKKV